MFTQLIIAYILTFIFTYFNYKYLVKRKGSWDSKLDCFGEAVANSLVVGLLIATAISLIFYFIN